MKPLEKCKDESDLPGKVDCLIDVAGKGIDVVSERFDGVDKRLEINGNLIIDLNGRMDNLEREMREGFNVLPTLEQFNDQGRRVQAEIGAIRAEMATTRALVNEQTKKMDVHLVIMDEHARKMDAHSKKMDDFDAKIGKVLDALKERREK